MHRALPAALLAAAALTIPVGTATAKPAPVVTYKGKATSSDGSQTFGASSFTFKKGKLVKWNADAVPRQCATVELMNYGFTVASNILKAYGLKGKDVKLNKKGRLKFTYTQPNHSDRITVKVTFGAKKASGTIVNTPGPGERSTLNCSGSGKVTLKK